MMSLIGIWKVDGESGEEGSAGSFVISKALYP